MVSEKHIDDKVVQNVYCRVTWRKESGMGICHDVNLNFFPGNFDNETIAF